MGRDRPSEYLGLMKQTRGGVLALAALFLPVAVLCAGLVADLGALFFAGRSVQAACDLGALAGVQELDWDLLASGTVALRAEEAEMMATYVAGRNLEAVYALVRDAEITATVMNPPGKEEPTVAVTIRYAVRMPFLRAVPGLGVGFRDRRASEASVVRRTKW